MTAAAKSQLAVDGRTLAVTNLDKVLFPARAGEDTAAVADLMLSGGTLAYWPGAVVWHRPKETLAELEQQLGDYGSGLTACYTRAVLRDPRRPAAPARLALRGQCGTSGPARLRRAARHGLLAGPARYLRSRIQHQAKRS